MNDLMCDYCRAVKKEWMFSRTDPITGFAYRICSCCTREANGAYAKVAQEHNKTDCPIDLGPRK